VNGASLCVKMAVSQGRAPGPAVLPGPGETGISGGVQFLRPVFEKCDLGMQIHRFKDRCTPTWRQAFLQPLSQLVSKTLFLLGEFEIHALSSSLSILVFTVLLDFYRGCITMSTSASRPSSLTTRRARSRAGRIASGVSMGP